MRCIFVIIYTTQHSYTLRLADKKNRKLKPKFACTVPGSANSSHNLQERTNRLNIRIFN